MKKNRMMRLASVLLVLCLLTTSVISGTFAKYVTTDAQQDSARVAKWGVVASIDGNLFGATYDQSEAIISWSENADSVSSAQSAATIVAPGTQNENALTLSISGKPEVSTLVTYDAAENGSGADYANSDIYLAQGTYGVMVEYTGEKNTETFGNYYIYNNDKYVKLTEENVTDNTDKTWYELHDEVAFAEDYHPLVWSWTVKVENETDVTATEKTFAEMEAEVRKTFPAGTDALEFAPNSFINRSITIGWKWAFGQAWTDTSSQDEINATDKKDTILGNMMAYFVEDTDGTAAEKVVALVDGNYVNVSYDTVNVKSGSANNKQIVMVDGEEIACLTVAFNARLTVEQVD